MEKNIKFSISKEIVSTMEPVVFPGHITVINSVLDADKALKFLSTQPIVGIDTETRPNYKKGQRHKVALVQISTSDHAFLFRINRFGLCDTLKDFFEDESIVKVGLSLRDDFHQLHALSEFEPKGFVDLQELVKEYNIVDASLQKIYAIVFGKRITKNQQLSNWEAETLTESQKSYGAIDAWACLKLYNTLTSDEFDSENCPYIKPEEPDLNNETEEV